jgi:hypothetical protein
MDQNIVSGRTGNPREMWQKITHLLRLGQLAADPVEVHDALRGVVVG